MNKKFHITAFIGLLVFLWVLTLGACAAQPTATSTFEAKVDMPTAAPTLLPPLPKSVSLPPGFVAYVPELGVMLFQNTDGTRIIKLLIQETSKTTIPTGLDGSEETMIHDRSTLIVRGKYDENGKWDAIQKNVQLYWQKSEWTYILSSETVSEVELIKMAESIE